MRITWPTARLTRDFGVACSLSFQQRICHRQTGVPAFGVGQALKRMAHGALCLPSDVSDPSVQFGSDVAPGGQVGVHHGLEAGAVIGFGQVHQLM